VCGDRGTSSAANSRQLEAMGVADHLGPRAIASFREKMQDEEFAQGQQRRAQTEGRISILKNQFLGHPLLPAGERLREPQAGGILGSAQSQPVGAGPAAHRAGGSAQEARAGAQESSVD